MTERINPEQIIAEERFRNELGSRIDFLIANQSGSVTAEDLLRRGMRIDPSEIPNPIEMSPPFRQQEIIEVDRIPGIIVMTDTHLMPQNEETPSSTKRTGYGLWRIPAFRNGSRLVDNASWWALRQLAKPIESALSGDDGADVIFHAGDAIDSYTTGSFLSAMGDLESYVQKRFQNADRNGRAGYYSVGEGNHEKAYQGPDLIAGYAGLKGSMLSEESFTLIVNAIKSGISIKAIASAFSAAGKEVDISDPIIHPAMRWYIFRLVTGPEVGMFQAKQDEANHSMAFLNSEFNGPGCTLLDLEESLKRIGLFDTSIGQEVLETYKDDFLRQERVIDSLLNELINDSDHKATVYAHNPVRMQEILAGEMFAKLIKHSETVAFEDVMSLVQDRILVIGGHYHFEPKKAERRKGVRVLSAISRQLMGPLAMKPAEYPSIFGSEGRLQIILGAVEVILRQGTFQTYPKGDKAEILIGSADDPRSVFVDAEDIMSTFNSLKRKSFVNRAGQMLKRINIYAGGGDRTRTAVKAKGF